MLYFISNQQQLFNYEDAYKLADISDLDNYLNSVECTGLDLETEGFDAHTKKPLTIQFGDYNDQYVVDLSTVNIIHLKDRIESITLLGQNLKFDLKFLYKMGIYPRKIYDTMIVEKIIYCGISTIRVALDEITERYLGFRLDKTIRGSIHKEGLTTRVIKYAADDVKFLEAIRQKQLEIINEQDLLGVVNLENKFTPVLAYIEYCGFKLDIKKWNKKMELDNIRLKESEQILNNYILSKNMNKYFKQQLSLFDPISCSINWSSSKQVISLFEELGINVTVVEKGIPKKSVEASVLENQKKDFDILPLYLNYKKAEKVTSTYGSNFIRQINTNTNRIHTSFKQIMDTGRLSSGGKDKSTKEEYVNFQNIPSDPITRSCFVAEEGNTLIISDYSGQEQIVLANRALDKNLLYFYDSGLADMHSFIASKMYPELNGLDLDEIKTKHKSKRQAAKSAGFAINYGGTGVTIANNLGISKEEGDYIYNSYFKAFPGLRSYFDTVKQQGLRDGFVLISPITRRKSYIEFFDTYKKLEADLTPEFWERYKWSKSTNDKSYPNMKEKVSKYFLYKGDIERKTLNFPIQGSSAEITKISCIYIYKYILDNNLFGIVKFVNTIHDENVLECPIEMSNAISDMVKDCMCRAGELFCRRVPLKADPELSLFWKK